MLTKNATIRNQEGFHARPAQKFVESASKFTAHITVKKLDGAETDGKSILGLMTLELSKGSTISIQADGVDEEKAVDSLIQLVENKFGEE